MDARDTLMFVNIWNSSSARSSRVRDDCYRGAFALQGDSFAGITRVLLPIRVDITETRGESGFSPSRFLYYRFIMPSHFLHLRNSRMPVRSLFGRAQSQFPRRARWINKRIRIPETEAEQSARGSSALISHVAEAHARSSPQSPSRGAFSLNSLCPPSFLPFPSPLLSLSLSLSYSQSLCCARRRKQMR